MQSFYQGGSRSCRRNVYAPTSDQPRAPRKGHGAESETRGEKPSDLKAITEIIQRVSQLVMDFPEIVELDINPVVAHHQGAVALDARLSIKA